VESVVQPWNHPVDFPVPGAVHAATPVLDVDGVIPGPDGPIRAPSRDLEPRNGDKEIALEGVEVEVGGVMEMTSICVLVIIVTTATLDLEPCADES
jgi:hypothetical protein